jgi:prolipoprotein diacylglyceryltransferase
MLGFITMAFVVWRSLRDAGVEDERIFDNIIVVTLLSFIGARAAFVLTHWELFAPGWLRVLVPWKFPGFSFWGGLLMAILTIFFYSRSQKLLLSLVADAYARSFPWLLFWGGLAVFLDGSVVGKPVAAPLGVVMIGQTGTHFPVGLLAAGLGLISVVGVWLLGRQIQLRHLSRGILGWSVLSAIGIIQLILSISRNDLFYWHGFPVDYILSTVIGVGPLVPLFNLLNGRKNVLDTWSNLKNRLQKVKKT